MSKNCVYFKLIAVCLVISLLVIHLGQLPVNAVDEMTEIEKVYCNATLEDAFTEDEIIIVVNPEWNNKEYTVNDFASISCMGVEEIADSEGEGVLSRILLLTIADGTKQKVLDAIKLLEEREDVHSAESNYLESMGDTFAPVIPQGNVSVMGTQSIECQYVLCDYARISNYGRVGGG